MTLAKFSLTGEPVALHRHLYKAAWEDSLRSALQSRLHSPVAPAHFWQVLHSLHFTGFFFFYIRLCHKCQNSASSRKPAVALAAEMNLLAHSDVKFTLDGVTCLRWGNLTITGWGSELEFSWGCEEAELTWQTGRWAGCPFAEGGHNAVPRAGKHAGANSLRTSWVWTPEETIFFYF